MIRIKESAYVESARVVGASTWRIMTKHLFKNSTRTLPVILTLNSSEAILTLAGLGFLGFGIEPTAAAEWGYDLNRSVSRNEVMAELAAARNPMGAIDAPVTVTDHDPSFVASAWGSKEGE